MPIARLIYISVDPEQIPAAIRSWKQECAPLMISAPGCLSEELLRCTDVPGELISYSEWDTQDSIDAYQGSDAHTQIKEHTAHLRVADRPVVKLYEVAG